MLLQLIQCDNDSGHTGARMGQGPGHILAGGLVERLRDDGHRAEIVRVTTRESFPTEIAAAFEVAAALARQVRMASRQRRFPIVLAGNCMASVGVVAGLPRGRTGLIWLDAHGDMHTPESTRSGFLDGMAIATTVGLCWTGMTSSIPGFKPLSPGNVLLLGTRDVDEEEAEHLGEHGIRRIGVSELRSSPEGVSDALQRLIGATDRVHLHVDLDVLDPEEVGPANRFGAGGGLLLEELLALVHSLRALGGPASATFSAYDPSVDEENRIRYAAHEVIASLVS